VYLSTTEKIIPNYLSECKTVSFRFVTFAERHGYMNFNDLPPDQRCAVIETLKYWLNSTAGNLSLSARITNRKLGLTLTNQQYRTIKTKD